MFSFMVLNKSILVGIITLVIIIIAIGLFVVLGNSERLDIDDQSINDKPYIGKKITIELSDGVNMGGQ